MLGPLNDPQLAHPAVAGVVALVESEAAWGRRANNLAAALASIVALPDDELANARVIAARALKAERIA